MRWCTDEELASLLKLPNGYSIERLDRAGVPGLMLSLRKWYPDISVGSGSAYLSQTFYDSRVALHDEADKDIAVWVFRHSGAMVGMFSSERIEQSKALYGRLWVFSPEHRNSGIATSFALSVRERARLQGAEYVDGNATLKHVAAQHLLEKLGYQLIGITPGADRELAPDGSVKRVYEAVYALNLASESATARPDPANLTPRTRALFDFLFAQVDDTNAA